MILTLLLPLSDVSASSTRAVTSTLALYVGNTADSAAGIDRPVQVVASLLSQRNAAHCAARSFPALNAPAEQTPSPPCQSCLSTTPQDDFIRQRDGCGPDSLLGAGWWRLQVLQLPIASLLLNLNVSGLMCAPA